MRYSRRALAATLALAASARTAFAVSADSQVVRSASSTAPVRFVAQSTLVSASLDQLPIQESCRANLSSDLLLAGSRERSIHDRFPERPAPSSTAKSMAEFLISFPTVVVGNVVHVEVGWDCHYRTVARRVDIEIAQNVLGDLKDGATIALIEPGGELSLGGAQYNWGDSKVLPALEVGTSVLVAGYLDVETTPRTIGGGARFRILGQNVEPIAALELAQRSQSNLASLLASVRMGAAK
jgi:hypothetical protein